MRKIFIGVLSILICFIGVSCTNNKKVEKENYVVEKNEVTTYEIIEERKADVLAEKDTYLEYDFEVLSVDIKETSLEIVVKAELDDFNAVYGLGRYISDYIKSENKAKINLYGIDKELVFFEGKNRFLYDGTEAVKLVK